MFERFNTPAEAYQFKLGAALTMEQKILEVLDENIGAANDKKVKDLLRAHQDETRDHIEILEQVFGAFEWEVDESPCPTIEGLEKEGKAMLRKTDDSFVDSVILQGALEIEAHEIGVYTNLMLNARAMGRQDVVDLLQRNRRSEEKTMQKVIETQENLAAVKPKAARA